jgi:3-methylornithyl-N6-L-lysine dehydrogenase
LTRLIAEQVRAIPGNLEVFDRELKKKTGSSLLELAVDAAGRGADQIRPASYTVAIIPVTAGLGKIEGFTDAIQAIAAYLGFKTFVTSATDVAGLVEAYRSEADMLMLADDQIYAAVNLHTRVVAGNDQATAAGFTATLKKMAGTLKGKEVLLIGAGTLGIEAAKALLKEDATLIVLDLIKKREKSLAANFSKAEQQRVITGLNLKQSLSRVNLVFEASPGDAFIKADWLAKDTAVVAPGLPLGLDPGAATRVEGKLIHEPLQIGTAVMLFQALHKR